MNDLETTVTKLVKFWSLTDGRDKTSKVVQYGCRAWIALLVNKFGVDKASRLVADVNRVMGSVAQSRKVFRFGKTVNFLPKVLSTLRALSKGTEGSTDVFHDRLLALARDVGLGVYFVFDGMVWLSQIKVLRSPKTDVISLRARRAWFFGLVASLLISMRTYARLIEQETRLQGAQDDAATNERSALRAKRNAAVRSMIKIVGDLQVAGVGVMPRYAPGPLRIALGGLVSAVISCYELWK